MWPAFIPAGTLGTGGFSALVQAVAGNNTLTIEAEDFSPQANRRTATYRVQVNGSNRVPGYDFNGNLIDNGSGQTYEWDAENRLVKITYADQTSTEFRYDGQSRRVGITEKDAARVVTSEKRYLWAEGAQPAEERAADGRTVVKQYHAQGEFLPGAVAPLNKVFYTKDHLGSVRELVNGNGTLQTRYDYDLWGGRTKITGTVESEVGYTGHHHHGKSGLVLTWYRAYDPVTGRWLSRDPIGEEGGINLYGYVLNNPVNAVDPLGLLAFGDEINYPGTDCNGLYPGEGVGSNGSSFGDSLYKAWDLFQKVKAGKINDKYAHCVAHCEISRDLGPEVSDAIGKGKEFADWCKKEVGGGGAGWDSEDEKANKDGRSAAKKTQKSCEVACAEGGYSP